MVQSLLHLPVAREPAASFAIAVGMSLPLAVERLADEFSSAVQFPEICRHHRSSDSPWRPLICADEDLTLTKLKHV